MSAIRSSQKGKNAASFRFEVAPEEKKMEPFLWKLLMLTALTYFIWSEKISIDIGPFSVRKTMVEQQFSQRKTDFMSLLGFHETRNTGVLLDNQVIDNLTFALDPTYQERYEIPGDVVQPRMERCALFVKRFSPVAIAEMRCYGIPASILLAQALLASDAGENDQSVKANNFFQRPCKAGQCRSDHFPLTVDPEATGLMDVFPNLWGSFRAQSLYLKNTAPYAILVSAGNHDYRKWADYLNKAGYSTDAQYGEKLVALVYSLHLDRYDRR